MSTALAQVFPGYLSDKTKWSGFRNDFYSDEDLAQFIVTALAVGTCAVSDTAVGTGIATTASTSTTADMGASCQLDAASMSLVPGRWHLFGAKLNFTAVTTTTNQVLGFGLGSVDTTIVAGIDEYIGFYKDADTALDFRIRNDNAATYTNDGLATVAGATEYVLEFAVNVAASGQTGRVIAWLNEIDSNGYVVNITRLFDATSVALPVTSEALTLTFFAQSAAGSATAITVNWDYVDAFIGRNPGAGPVLVPGLYSA